MSVRSLPGQHFETTETRASLARGRTQFSFCLSSENNDPRGQGATEDAAERLGAPPAKTAALWSGEMKINPKTKICTRALLLPFPLRDERNVRGERRRKRGGGGGLLGAQTNKNGLDT